jgi:hypothetical protein
VQTPLVIITENKNVKCSALISIISKTMQNHPFMYTDEKFGGEKINKMSKITKYTNY